MVGKVKWFDEKKGFGFITADEKDYFVHYSKILKDGFKTLVENQEVEFEGLSTDKGLIAINVIV